MRRTPRRTLGVLNNNGNAFSNSGAGATPGVHPSSSDVPSPSPHEVGVGGGLGGASQMSWPSQAGKNMKTLDSSLGASGASQQPVKPPLYVPSRRQPSENAARRSTDKGAKGPPGAPGAYVSKTGFSSLGGPSSSPAPVPKKENSARGAGGFGGGYIPTAMQR